MKLLLFAALICGSPHLFAQKSNFSGTYKVNEEKVNWGPAPKYILPRYIKVDQLKDKVVISRTALDQQLKEQTPVIDTIAFDGSVFSKNRPTAGKIESSLKWIDDKSFVLVRKSIGADGNISGTTTETWSLQDDGKTLFINRDVESNMKYTTKAYFDKI